jgi:hypothetical protein
MYKKLEAKANDAEGRLYMEFCPGMRKATIADVGSNGSGHFAVVK